MKIHRTLGLGIAKLIPALALTSLCGVSCVAATGDEGDGSDLTMADEPTMAAEASYMREVFEGLKVQDNLGFMRIDLSDEKQYSFLAHRLMKSGKTPQNSPRLFESLKTGRAAHAVKPPTQPMIGGEPVAATSQALSGDPCGQFLDTPVTSDASASHVRPMSYLNCFGGAAFPYGYADVAAYETDASQSYLTPLAYDAVESYTGVAQITTPQLDSQLSVNVGKFHFVDAISYTEDQFGGTYSTYTSFRTAAADVRASLGVTHPADFTMDGVIRSCIKRAAWAGNGDCDYAGVDANGFPSQTAVGVAKMTYLNGNWQADPAAANRWFPLANFQQFTNLYLPLAGTFDAGTVSSAACQIQSFNSARAVMSLATGGWCISGTGNVNTDIYTNLRDKVGARTASYNVVGNFGADCLSLVSGTANTVPVKVTHTIAATTTCGLRSANLPVSSIDFKDSCFAKGTGVLRSDGKYVAVEELKIGDRVLADGRGLALTIVSVARGGERHPMVQIVDDKGHSLMLTETHPVITSEGVLPAGELRSGLGVQTESGPAVIVDVERVGYDDAVYNLSLGTASELSTLDANDRTMFAGGIRVGDNEMQTDLQKAMHQPLIRTEVAPQWAADHRHAMARAAK